MWDVKSLDKSIRHNVQAFDSNEQFEVLEYKPLKEWWLEMKFSSLDENFIIGIWWVKSIWRWHQRWPASCNLFECYGS